MLVRKSPLERLPVEILQAIMASLAEVTSLPSFVLACSTFYFAFKDSEAWVIQQILDNEIGKDVLPEAVVTLKLGAVQGNANSNPVSKIKGQFQSKRKQLSVTPSFDEAIALSKFHVYVRFFAADFASRALAQVPSDFFVTEKRNARTSELRRIERTFYRFQMFVNIFTKTLIPLVSYDAMRIAFFGSFSPWEIAQLGCLNDYFFSIVGCVFNEFVEHDVVWGNNQVPYLAHATAAHFQNILNRGLEDLYSIVKAQTYEEKYLAIYTLYPKTDGICFLSSFNSIAVEVDHDDFLNMDDLFDLTVEDGGRFILPPYYDEEDSGPKDAWFEAHAGACMHEWFYCSTLRIQAISQRAWGYVMWDSKRIEEWKLVDGFKRFDHSKQLEDRKHVNKGQNRTIDSWPRRAYIYLAGGRGWMSEDDETKLIWSGKSSPWDDEEARAKCEYCIGKVRCAPHRTVLRIPGVARPEESGNPTLLGRLRVPQTVRLRRIR